MSSDDMFLPIALFGAGCGCCSGEMVTRRFFPSRDNE